MTPPKMIDNKRGGTVADELRQDIQKDSKLSIMTAYFSIYAFSELKKELLKVVLKFKELQTNKQIFKRSLILN